MLYTAQCVQLYYYHAHGSIMSYDTRIISVVYVFYIIMIVGFTARTFIVTIYITLKRPVNSIADQIQSTRTSFSINAIYTICAHAAIIRNVVNIIIII